MFGRNLRHLDGSSDSWIRIKVSSNIFGSSLHRLQLINYCWNNEMGVSKNRGGWKPPKSSILIGFSIIFTVHFGGFPPIFGNSQMDVERYSVGPEQLLGQVLSLGRNLIKKISGLEEIGSTLKFPWLVGLTYCDLQRVVTFEGSHPNHEISWRCSSPVVYECLAFFCFWHGEFHGGICQLIARCWSIIQTCFVIIKSIFSFV